MPLLSAQDRRDDAEGTGIILIGAIIFVLAAFAIGALVWWLGVFSSGTKGSGDEEKQKNSVTNRVHWQNEFASLDQNIQTYAAQIVTARATAAAHPGDPFDEQNLAGLVQECDIAVGQYNADAQMPIASPWLPAGLPTSFNRSTVCGG